MKIACCILNIILAYMIFILLWIASSIKQEDNKIIDEIIISECKNKPLKEMEDFIKYYDNGGWEIADTNIRNKYRAYKKYLKLLKKNKIRR